MGAEDTPHGGYDPQVEATQPTMEAMEDMEVTQDIPVIDQETEDFFAIVPHLMRQISNDDRDAQRRLLEERWQQMKKGEHERDTLELLLAPVMLHQLSEPLRTAFEKKVQERLDQLS